MLSTLQNIRIHLPENKIGNSGLAEKFNTTPEEIFRKTGIEFRYHSAKNELASDMAVKLAEKFFNEFPEKKSQTDFFIFCSECFDFIAPASSCIIQDRLSLPRETGCLDLPYGCSGYIYGLFLAKSLLKSGMAQNILFISADTPSKTIPENNLELLNIFSDAATLTWLTQKDADKIGEFVLGTDGSGKDSLKAINSAFRREKDDLQQGFCRPEMVMDGIEIFNFGLREVPSLIRQTLEKNKLTEKEIDFFVLHQPTHILLQSLRKKMGIPEEKWIININRYGNTVSSSIPLVMADLVRENRIKPGMKLLLAGFGIGYSWGATILKT